MSKENSTLYSLLVSSLVLLGLALCVGAMLLALIAHPEWFSRNEEPEDVIVPERVVESAPMGPLASAEGEVKDGIDVATGFVAEGAYKMVKMHCTACHSAKLVLQNRATREGWKEMVHWMQETQNLWDLGEQEAPILDYLAKHYGPVKKGRRLALEIETWYEIP